MFNPRALFTLAAFGAASALFGGNALLPQEPAPQETLEASSRGSLPPQDIVVSTGDLTGSNNNKYKKYGKGKRSKTDNAAGRQDWWRQRMGGDLTPTFMARVMREAEKQRLLHPERFEPNLIAPNLLPEGVALPLAVSGTTWISLGPTTSNKIQNGSITRTDVNSGRLRAILPDTGDVNTLYVLSADGGLWKTTNLLSTPPTWMALSDSVGSTSGGAVAFGSVSTGPNTVLYLGMGDFWDLGVGGFIVKSTNAGTSWSSPIQLTSAAPALTATRILDIKVDGAVILVGTNVGLFRSTNGGTSYSLVNDSNMNGNYVWSLARTGVNTWVAAAEDFLNSGTGVMLQSTTGGATWNTVTLPRTTGRMSLAVGLPGESTVYCFAARILETSQRDLFFSTNGGSSWTRCQLNNIFPSNLNGDQPDMDLMAGQAAYNQMILVDPTDATRQTVYLGGRFSTAWTQDARAGGGGSHWTLLTNWLPGADIFGPPTSAAMPYAHADFHCAAFTNVGGTKRLLFGNDGGLAIGTGTAWSTWDHSKNVGLVTHLFYTLVSGPLNNCDANSVLGGLQDNGIHNRIGATSVFDQTLGGDGFGVGWSQATNTASLGSNSYNDIFRCTTNPPDDISKWNIVNPFTNGLPGTPGNDGEYYFVTPIITPSGAADSTGTVFFSYSAPNLGFGSSASNRIFQSNSTSWSTIARADTSANTTTGLTAGRYVRPVSHGLGIHPTDINRIAAAGNNGVVMMTTNGGTNWIERDLLTLVPPSGGRLYQGLNANVEWVDNNILYACSESTVANSIHVAKTVNGGAAWAAADTGLPDLPVTKIVCDRGDPTGNTLYAATWLGVYRTTDGGANWSLFGSGLPQVRIADIYVHPNSAFIRASAWGRGIWQLGTTPTYTAPVIGTQPVGGAFTDGTPFSLSVAATPSYPALSYQWRRGGVNLANGGAQGISGVTTATLTVSTPSCTSNGDYDVVITNCTGSTTSDIATMSNGVTAPVIITQPLSGAFTNGVPFSLMVAATPASPAPSYQWRRGGVNLANGGAEGIAGVTTANLTVSTPNCSSNGNYTVVVTNCAGSTTSNIATMSNGVFVPFIETPPFSGSFTPGTPFTLNTYAIGGALTYQWRRNGVNLANGGAEVISGATASSLTVGLPGCAVSAGNYDVVVSNCAGMATSVPAIMTSTNPGAAITAQPPNAQFETGNSFSLPVVATGPGLTYRWTKGGVDLTNGNKGGGGTGWVVAGATTATLSITNAQAATAGTYACKITSSGGCLVTTKNSSVVWSDNGNAWVAPNIVTNPSDVTVLAPTSASFTVVAGGGRVDGIFNRQFTFQWRRNGVNLTNAAPYSGAVSLVLSGTNTTASSTLTINPTSVPLSGNFDCEVTTSSVGNPGPVYSAIGVLRVNQYTPALAVSITPSSPSPVTTGTPVVFTAVGSGSQDGLGNPSPASAYQYQFWVRWAGVPWYTMVQDYGVGSTYTLPASTPPGDYGIGVDVRTSPYVLWDTFNAINHFIINPVGPITAPLRNMSEAEVLRTYPPFIGSKGIQ